MDIELSSKLPTTITHTKSGDIGSIKVENNIVTIPMMSIGSNKPNYIVTVYMLSIIDNYVKALWYKDADLEWQRHYTEINNIKTFYPSVNIKYYNPEDKFQSNPYWQETIIEVINPIMQTPYFVYIVKTNYPSGIILGQISNQIWNKEVNHQQLEHIETQPLPRPGEEIQLKWIMNVDSTIKDYPVVLARYETPLFSGGIVKAKNNTGVDITYDIEVFGNMIYNIMPTDFYDYKIGKWVYLLKDIQLTGQYQEYGWSDITSDNTTDEESFIQAINNVRASNGLNSLVANKFLINAAKNHAQDMATNNYFSHTGLDTREPLNRVTDANYFNDLDNGASTGVGENIALYSKEEAISIVINNWLNSPDHRANILNSDWKEIGFVIQKDSSGNYYYVNDFAFRSDGINKGIDSIYRVAPFNFLGIPHIKNYMAIDYPNPLQIDSALDFEKVFDMVTYKGTITKLYNQNDTAEVSINNITYTLPIFYHCEGKTRDVNGGSSAFKIGDEVIVENPANENNFNDACIIGFPNKLSSCGERLLINIAYKTNTYKSYHGVWNFGTNMWESVLDNNNNLIQTPCESNLISNFLSDLEYIETIPDNQANIGTSILVSPSSTFSDMWKISAPAFEHSVLEPGYTAENNVNFNNILTANGYNKLYTTISGDRTWSGTIPDAGTTEIIYTFEPFARDTPTTLDYDFIGLNSIETHHEEINSGIKYDLWTGQAINYPTKTNIKYFYYGISIDLKYHHTVDAISQGTFSCAGQPPYTSEIVGSGTTTANKIVEEDYIIKSVYGTNTTPLATYNAFDYQSETYGYNIYGCWGGVGVSAKGRTASYSVNQKAVTKYIPYYNSMTYHFLSNNMFFSMYIPEILYFEQYNGIDTAHSYYSIYCKTNYTQELADSNFDPNALSNHVEITNFINIHLNAKKQYIATNLSSQIKTLPYVSFLTTNGFTIRAYPIKK